MLPGPPCQCSNEQPIRPQGATSFNKRSGRKGGKPAEHSTRLNPAPHPIELKAKA